METEKECGEKYLGVPFALRKRVQELSHEVARAASVREALPSLNELHNVITGSLELEALHQQGYVQGLVAQKLLRELWEHELRGQPFSLPRSQLETAICRKLQEYKASDEVAVLASSDQIEKRCIRAFYMEIFLRGPAQQCAAQVQKSFDEQVRWEYEEVRKRYRLLRNLEEPDFVSADRLFYLQFLQAYMKSLNQGTLRKRGKVVPQTKEDCEALYDCYAELSSRLRPLLGGPLLVPLPQGKRQMLVPGEEYFPLLLLSRFQQQALPEEFATYKRQLAADVQEQLYAEAAFAAKERNRNLFSLWGSAFLRWSQNFQSDLLPTDETPQREMQDLAQRFFPPGAETTSTAQYTNE